MTADIYAGLFLLAAALWPVAVGAAIAGDTGSPATVWTFTAIFLLIWLYFLFRVSRACTTPNISYWKGLTVISGSMMTGCANVSIFIVFPALLSAFLASVSFMISQDIRNRPGEAGLRWEKLVLGFYNKRVRR